MICLKTSDQIQKAILTTSKLQISQCTLNKPEIKHFFPNSKKFHVVLLVAMRLMKMVVLGVGEVDIWVSKINFYKEGRCKLNKWQTIKVLPKYLLIIIQWYCFVPFLHFTSNLHWFHPKAKLKSHFLGMDLLILDLKLCGSP